MSETYYSFLSTAIAQLFAQSGSFLLGIGKNMVHLTLVVSLAWHVVTQIFADRIHPGSNFRFLVSWFGTWLLISFFATPFAGSVSFTGLITDESRSISQRLEMGANQALDDRLNQAVLKTEKPGASLIPNVETLYYFVVISTIAVLRFAMLAVVGFSFIALGIGKLLGPLVVSSLLWPGMEWMFWSWFKAFIQYAAYGVVGSMMIFVIAIFLANFFDSLPAVRTTEQTETYFITFVAAVLFSIYSVLKVPSLTVSYFSGRAGEGFFRG